MGNSHHNLILITFSTLSHHIRRHEYLLPRRHVRHLAGVRRQRRQRSGGELDCVLPDDTIAYMQDRDDGLTDLLDFSPGDRVSHVLGCSGDAELQASHNGE